MSATAKTERIQLRTSADAKQQILEAAAVTQQDATSFILEAATSRAREVLLESRILKFSDRDWAIIEEVVSQTNEPAPALIDVFKKAMADTRIAL